MSVIPKTLSKTLILDSNTASQNALLFHVYARGIGVRRCTPFLLSNFNQNDKIKNIYQSRPLIGREITTLFGFPIK